MMQRFKNYRDFFESPLARSGKKIVEDEEFRPVHFETGTWQDIKNQIWDHHYDILRTQEYHPPIGEDAPYRPELEVTVITEVFSSPPTAFVWHTGPTQSGTLPATVGPDPYGIESSFVPYGTFVSVIDEGPAFSGPGFGDWPRNIRFVEAGGPQPIPYLAYIISVSGGSGASYDTVVTNYSVEAQMIVNFRSLCASGVRSAHDPGTVRKADKKAQIISALRYKESWDQEFELFRHGFMALIIDGLPTAYHNGEFVDNDYRWGTHTYDAADHGLKQHGNPFGLLIDGVWVQGSRSLLLPSGTKEISYAFVTP